MLGVFQFELLLKIVWRPKKSEIKSENLIQRRAEARDPSNTFIPQSISSHDQSQSLVYKRMSSPGITSEWQIRYWGIHFQVTP